MPGIDVKKVIPLTMQAMVMEQIGQPLVLTNLPVPTPAADQVLVKIFACGVCRTDLHIVDGELPHPTLPLILGHEITGMVAAKGNKVSLHTEGGLVGIPWLAYTCGKCRYCMKNQENLCEKAMFTGYTVNGGYSEYIVADERFCFPLSRKYAKPAGAPLLCAGLIGYWVKGCNDWAFMALARRRIFLSNWPSFKKRKYMLSPGQVTRQLKNLQKNWVQCGRKNLHLRHR